VTITFHHISLKHVFNMTFRYLVYLSSAGVQYCFTRNLSGAYQTLKRKYEMQYRSRCNIFKSFGNALLFRYI